MCLILYYPTAWEFIETHWINVIVKTFRDLENHSYVWFMKTCIWRAKTVCCDALNIYLKAQWWHYNMTYINTLVPFLRGNPAITEITNKMTHVRKPCRFPRDKNWDFHFFKSGRILVYCHSNKMRSAKPSHPSNVSVLNLVELTQPPTNLRPREAPFRKASNARNRKWDTWYLQVAESVCGIHLWFFFYYVTLTSSPDGRRLPGLHQNLWTPGWPSFQCRPAGERHSQPNGKKNPQKTTRQRFNIC